MTLKLRGTATNLSPGLYSNASGSPGTSLATLSATNVSSVDPTEYVFTCSSGCQLTSGTTYHVVVDIGRLDVMYWVQNTSGSETNTPADAGWSIADDAKYRNGQGGSWLSEGAVKLMKVTWAVPTLTASSVEAMSATLTVANYSGNWYYKYTAPTGGQCSSSPVSGTSKTLSGLNTGTTYTFKAYSDSTCSNEVATASSFTTKPAKVTGLSVTGGNQSLAVSWSAETGATGYTIQWKSDGEEFGSGQQATPTSNSHSITGLVNGTVYSVRVRATTGGGDGAWSDTATGTPALPDLWVENITWHIANLWLRNWTGGTWSYKVVGQKAAGCYKPRGSSTYAVLDILAPDTDYTVTAHSGLDCVSANLLDTETFTTRASDWKLPALSVSNVGSTSATLTIANHTGNWWYAKTRGDTTCTKVDTGTSSATLSGLTPNTFYRYKAYSAAGCANSTTPLDWMTLPVDFTTTGTITVTVTDQTATSVQLSVSGVTSAKWSTDYLVTGDPLLRYSQCQTYDQSTSSATVTGLTAGTSYTFYMYSGDSCAFLHNRIVAQAHTLQLSVGNVGATTATLTLNHHDGDWWHQEVVGGGAGAAGAANTSSGGVCTPVGNGSTATLSNLTTGTHYTYGAYGAATCSKNDELATATFTTQFDTAPDPVAAVTAAHQGSSLAVSWDAPARATHYHVTYTDNNGTSWQLGALEHSDTSLTINGVDSSKTYLVGVRAKNAAGYSGWVNSAAATFTAPDPVASVTAVHQGSSLEVTWPAAARATHYHVTYTGDNGTSWQLAALEHTGTSLTINGVDSSKTYLVGVRAKNAAGSSGWVNSAAATFTAPDPVASVTAVHKGSSLDVSWPAAARATHYHVTYTGDNGTSWQLAALEHSGTSLTINGVDSSKTYMVGVRAKNAAGYSGWVNSAPAAPPALSVANATAAEPEAGESTTLDFVVTLNRAASATVTVDYDTSDGTATAGADYTAASGTLSFQPGDTAKTVSVQVLDDSHNEGSETMTLTLSNATGAVIDSNAARATGTITNNDPIPHAWISRFGRTVADQVLEAVDTRLRSTSTPGLEVTLAGERLGWLAEPDETQPVAEQAVAQLAQWLVVGNDDNDDIAARTVTGSELLTNSSFALSSRTAGGALLSFWGRGAITSFEGREGDLSLDGEVATWMLGTDWSWGQWPDGQGGEAGRSTAGLLLSRSTSDGGWGYAGTGKGSSGDVEATLTGVFPWARHRFTDRLEAWGAGGYGQGDLEVTPTLPGTDKDGALIKTDLNLWLAAVGLRGTLLDGGNDGLTLTSKTDAMAVRTTSGSGSGTDGGKLESAQATVTRLRLGLEAHRPFPLGHPESGADAGSGATLTPSLELALRHDGGDAETGFGIDLGGGIVLSHPERGLEAELRGRGLLSHAAEGFRDRGFSASLSWRQKPESDLGAALSLTRTMGGSASGGADALLSRVTLEGLAASDTGGNDDLKNQRMEFQFSYGLPAFGDRFTLTPELGLGLHDSGRDYRIGWQLTRLAEAGTFALSFDVTRQEGTNTAPDHGVQLELNTRF